jgi:hypothetical protein
MPPDVFVMPDLIRHPGFPVKTGIQSFSSLLKKPFSTLYRHSCGSRNPSIFNVFRTLPFAGVTAKWSFSASCWIVPDFCRDDARIPAYVGMTACAAAYGALYRTLLLFSPFGEKKEIANFSSVTAAPIFLDLFFP